MSKQCQLFLVYNILLPGKNFGRLHKDIYELTREGIFSTDFSVHDQIRVSYDSARYNLAENFYRSSRAKLHHFIEIAKGPCAEVSFQLNVAQDLKFINDQQDQELMDKAEELSRIFGRLMSAVKKHRNER